MIVYLYKKCSTCQKALRFLESRNVPFILKEITEQPPSLEELQKMLGYQNGNIKKILNTSGLLYREMHLSEKLKGMSQLDILTLLSKEGMLIKRPFLLGADFGLVGFDEAKWSEV
jgi:arsenate reductase (glutaredoxin)